MGNESMMRMWVVTVLAFALFGCGPNGPDKPDLKIVPELCKRVRPGMTLQEVEVAIGGPPGFYEGTAGISYNPDGPSPRRWEGDESWIGRRGEVEVTFDKIGKAIEAVWYPAKQVWLR